jgi:hypothetical protein
MNNRLALVTNSCSYILRILQLCMFNRTVWCKGRQ